MSIIDLTPAAVHSIKAFLKQEGLEDPVRIDLQSTGCCDPSLGLSIDHVHESDIVHETEGIQFIISPETFKAVGRVKINFVDESERQGFVLTSSKPLSEWEGFGVCCIRKKEGS